MEKLLNFFNDIAEIDHSIIELMKNVFKPGVLEKGEHFIKKDEYAKEIAFLEEGYVRAYYVTAEGKEYNKTFFAAPTIIGSYASLISKQKNQVAQQALTQCKIWKASFQQIEAYSKDNIAIERLRRIIAENYFLLNEKKEIEMALLDANERYLILQKEYPAIELEIPQYHIAAYLGISATQLSRIRNKMAP